MKLIIILLFLNVVGACTSAGDQSQNPSMTDTTTPSITNWDVYYIETIVDLPECVQETLGRLYYVAAEDRFQVCTSTGWMKIELRGADGEPGSDGASVLTSVTDEATGPNCSAGGVRVDVGVDDNGDGILSSEEIDSTEYICNGPGGLDGSDGLNGANGVDGASGENGTSCSVQVTDCVATLSCDDGSSASWGGACELGDPCSRSTDCVSALCSEDLVCIEPCVGESRRRIGCGLNLEGVLEEICEAGTWVEKVGCTATDECVNGSERLVTCGLNDGGDRKELCVNGVWGADGDCVGACDNVVCDDDDSCFIRGCDPATGLCQVTNVLVNGSLCSDGDACTTGDACSFGNCVGVPIVCGDGNHCTVNTCDSVTGECLTLSVNGTACSDGSACTTRDTCLSGVCVGFPIDCDNSNDCLVDACDPATGQCQTTHSLANGASCSDGSACTTGDACLQGACVGVSKTCDDGDQCTVDTCEMNTGQCASREDLQLEGCNNLCGEVGACQAGTKEIQTIGCGNCGSQEQVRSCGVRCSWGGWAVAGSCQGQGPCTPGAEKSDSGSCGLGQVKTRTCSSNCAWGPWGGCH